MDISVEKSLIIDCDRAPYMPSGLHGYEVRDHAKGGLFKWEPEKIKLISFQEFQEKAGHYKPFNANVLDWLLLDPRQIPLVWKEIYVFFRGTTYLRSTGHPVFRCLGWHEEWQWFWSSRSIESIFDSKRVIAALEM